MRGEGTIMAQKKSVSDRVYMTISDPDMFSSSFVKNAGLVLLIETCLTVNIEFH